ncbi:hypothetical protein GGI18_002796 [Coemansia linderi]|uniref:Uncharacterized protein n=1 Tax=Coemansia linderi TaxID=2663919 RepID=A0ACC1KFD7_9FUNG|nr:hypothetical protein GGI18_002796 [Coemansia linderi]
MKAYLSTLDLLEDCPVCGATWPAHIASRADHTKRCAKRHGVSDKDLVDLVSMFRESLGSTSSISDPPDRDCQISSSAPSSGAGSRGCRAFIEAFNSPSLAPATPPVQQGSARGKKRPLNKKASRDRLLPRPIDGWFDRRSSSAEPDSASDMQSASSQSSQQPASSLLSMEANDCDDDFQIAKPRSTLTQSRIAVRRVSKKRQEYLDDLDDDLNVAKALSLSLKRGPDPAKRGKGAATGKRRENSVTRADALAKSDILASSEAQSLIRQRAVALERMDEVRQAAVLFHLGKDKTGVVATEPQHSDHSSMRLWDLGALPNASEREYCEIFESYKVRKG